MTDTVPEQPAEMKVCPSCAEPVRLAAKICRYCGYQFSDVSTAPALPAPPVRTSGILITIAGGLLVLGSFLPWATVHVFGRTIHRSGMDWRAGIFVLALGVITLLVGIAALVRLRLPNLTGLAIMIAGAIAAVLGIWEFARVSTRLNTFRALEDRFGPARGLLARFATGHVGIGLWAVIAGAVLAVVAGFMLQMAPPQEAPTAKATEGDQPATVSA